jgi:hypothetical protein
LEQRKHITGIVVVVVVVDVDDIDVVVISSTVVGTISSIVEDTTVSNSEAVIVSISTFSLLVISDYLNYIYLIIFLIYCYCGFSLPS